MRNNSVHSVEKLFLRLSLVIVLTTTAQAAQAQLLAYEGFDYDEGDLIEVAGGTLGGGTGWTTTPSNPSDPNDMNFGWYYEFLNDSSQQQQFRNVVHNPVPGDWGYTDSQGNRLATTGGRAEVVNFGGPAVRQLDLSGVAPNMLTTTIPGREEIGVDGSEVWISFLGLGTEIASASHIMVGGVNEETAHGGYDRAFGLGRPFHMKTDGTQGIDNEAWGVMDIQPEVTDPVAATGHAYDEKVFFVARINFGAGPEFEGDFDETVDIWIDPDLGATPPTNIDRAISDFVVYHFDFGAIELTGSANTFYDEIRIGLTYADVAPIAVPSGADFDDDGDVDGNDFLRWQHEFSSTLTATDLANWESEFGLGVGTLAALSAVPEPSTALLASIAVAGLWLRRNCMHRSY